jgi:toxin FitB
MLFETRYFWARFTSSQPDELQKLRMIFEEAHERSVSSVTLFEIVKLSIEKEGKDVAEIRATTITKEFKVVDVDQEIALEGGRLGARLRVPMADALIMATAKKLRVPCVTDDPHLTEVKRVWIRT